MAYVDKDQDIVSYDTLIRMYEASISDLQTSINSLDKMFEFLAKHGRQDSGPVNVIQLAGNTLSNVRNSQAMVYKIRNVLFEELALRNWKPEHEQNWYQEPTPRAAPVPENPNKPDYVKAGYVPPKSVTNYHESADYDPEKQRYDSVGGAFGDYRNRKPKKT